MVARLVYGIKRAVDPCYDVVQHRRAIGEHAVRDAGELIVALRCETPTQIALVAREHIDAKPTGALIRGQLVDDLSGKNATSGGARLTDVNEPTTIPEATPSASIAVTTHTPVG